MIRRWPTPPPMVRVGLLIAVGLALIGAALWAGAVGPWVGRPLPTAGPVSLPTLAATPTPPGAPTLPPPRGAASGSSWDPSVVLYVLGLVLLLVLLLVAAAMFRNRGRAAATRRRPPPAPEPTGVERLLPVPDADRQFDPREAADYVIACWEQLERQAAAGGQARRPEQTPTEFVEQLRAAYRIDAAAAAELLALYQRARFDDARLLPDTAPRARTCADVLLNGLAQGSAPQ